MTSSYSRFYLVVVVLLATSNCGGSPNDQPPLALPKLENAVEVGPLDMTHAEAATPMYVQPLSESLVVVVDSYEPKIALISSSTGQTVAFFNRKGRGPSELQSVGPLQLLSDSTLLIPDTHQGRAIVWRFSSGATSTIPLHQSATPPNIVPSLVGYAGNQQWVGRLQSMAQLQGATVRTTSDSSTLILTDSGGSRPLMRLSERLLVVAASSLGEVRVGFGGLAPAAFAICDSGFIDIDTSGVRRYSRSGAPVGSHRHRLGWIPMPVAVTRDYVKGTVSRVAESRTRTRMAAQLEAQATRINRWFTGFFIAPDGTVWIRVHSASENAIVQIDNSGTPIHAVAVPAGIIVVHVGVGYFIGMRTSDEPEMPKFMLLRFMKDSPGHLARWQCGKQQDY